MRAHTYTKTNNSDIEENKTLLKCNWKIFRSKLLNEIYKKINIKPKLGPFMLHAHTLTHTHIHAHVRDELKKLSF